MPDTVIKVENLGKRYQLGVLHHDRLAEAIGEGLRGIGCSFRRLFASDGREPPASPPTTSNPRAKSQKDEYIWALRDVSFEVKRGEVIGVIGRNGAGKSTLLKILTGIAEPTEGKAWLKGRVGSLLEVGTGFHPELTGRENIFMNGAILGMRRAEIVRKFDEIVDFSGVERFIDTPVKRYSSGMYVRLAFAVAAHLEPEILLVDEVLAVGDTAFQKRCLGKMGDVVKEGRTILFVSHNMPAIQVLCSRSILLLSGQLAADGSTHSVVHKYLAIRAARGEASLGPGAMRSGNGIARFTQVRLLNGDGKTTSYVPMNHGVTVEMQFECLEMIGHPSFAVRIVSPLQEGLVGWGTSVTHGEMPTASVGGIIRLHIERLPLLPGLYYLMLGLSDGHQIVDRIENALELEIVPSPIYPTGKIPSTELARFFTPCSWTHQYC